MMSVDVIGDVRRAYFEQKLLIKEIVRTLYPAKARRPQGPTVAHEIAGPRIGALESRRDAAMEDAAEAAEAAAGHRAAHGWTSRVIPGPARRRQAALDTEARRLEREARTLEAGHGRAVPAVERAARREATATADAVKTWRWSPPVRHAQRDLATAAAIRATLAGQDPATITAAARGDLRAAGRAAEACAAQKASPGEAGGTRWTRQEALVRCGRWEAGAGDDARLRNQARAITAAVVAGYPGATAAVAAGDNGAADEAAAAWRQRVAAQGQAAAPAAPAVTPAYAR